MPWSVFEGLLSFQWTWMSGGSWMRNRMPSGRWMWRNCPSPCVAAEKPKAGGNVGKAMAVKCDLCAGRSDMACIATCPCGAIERIDPSILLGSR